MPDIHLCVWLMTQLKVRFKRHSGCVALRDQDLLKSIIMVPSVRASRRNPSAQRSLERTKGLAVRKIEFWFWCAVKERISSRSAGNSVRFFSALLSRKRIVIWKEPLFSSLIYSSLIRAIVSYCLYIKPIFLTLRIL